MGIEDEEYEDFRDMVLMLNRSCPKLLTRLEVSPQNLEQALRQVQDVRMTLGLMLRFADRARKSMESYQANQEVQVGHRQGNVEGPGH